MHALRQEVNEIKNHLDDVSDVADNAAEKADEAQSLADETAYNLRELEGQIEEAHDLAEEAKDEVQDLHAEYHKHEEKHGDPSAGPGPRHRGLLALKTINPRSLSEQRWGVQKKRHREPSLFVFSVFSAKSVLSI